VYGVVQNRIEGIVPILASLGRMAIMCEGSARFMRATEGLTPEARAVLKRALQDEHHRPSRPLFGLVAIAVFLAFLLPSPFEKDTQLHADLSWLRPFVSPLTPIFRTGILNHRICRGAHIAHKMSYAPRCGRPTPQGVIVPVEFGRASRPDRAIEPSGLSEAAPKHATSPPSP
jgi:hypothetical protein